MTRLRLLIVPLVLTLGACDRPDADAPPIVHLGDSICVHCGMIISDERFAAATIVDDDRAPVARLFDDFNCQADDEVANPDLVVLKRWSRDYTNGEWLDAESAHFLASPSLRTPMASHVAAFASRADAESTREAVGGDVLSFYDVWDRLTTEK